MKLDKSRMKTIGDKEEYEHLTGYFDEFIGSIT
jgi:hypothetical protein